MQYVKVKYVKVKYVKVKYVKEKYVKVKSVKVNCSLGMGIMLVPQRKPWLVNSWEI